jgi:hypothetical protein
MQPAQLILPLDQVPAPPTTPSAQLPEPQLAEAVTILAGLIAKAAAPMTETVGSADE